MPTGLRWVRRDEGPPLQLALSGEIDELSDFASLLRDLGESSLLSLKDVSRINSTGVREWLNFMRAAKEQGRRLILEECSVAIVAQLNMISGFALDADVRSVYAPYVCPECDSAAQRLVDVKPDVHAQVEQPMPCPSCGCDMDFDELPQHYFAFMK